MKTFNRLKNQIVAFDNLLLAVKKASKGKKYKKSVTEFWFQQERELLRLQKELSEGSWKPGEYQTFMVYDPKERMISAAPFRDRVVHHALCNVIEPIFERTFIASSYANRKGKGTHRAIEEYQEYARQFPFVLKCDVRKFFPSLDHEILKQEIARKIYCRFTQRLCHAIIDGSNPQTPVHDYFPGDDLFTPHVRRRGLPIGNLTSQFWANVYLNRFDHFVKEQLKVPGYIRYVDDFVLFGESAAQLRGWKQEIERYLGDLRLSLHPNKTHIHRTVCGVPFLGFRTFPYRRVCLKAKVHRTRRHIRVNVGQLKRRKISPDRMESSLNSWLGHVRFGQSRRLEYNTYWELKHQDVNVFKHPKGSWRIL
jgi:retron-type reverse transcriptase